MGAPALRLAFVVTPQGRADEAQRVGAGGTVVDGGGNTTARSHDGITIALEGAEVLLVRSRAAASTLLMLTALCATLAHARRSEALSCVGPQPDNLTLELVSVTVNGAPMSDLSPWWNHRFRLSYATENTANVTVSHVNEGTLTCTLSRQP